VDCLIGSNRDRVPIGIEISYVETDAVELNAARSGDRGARVEAECGGAVSVLVERVSESIWNWLDRLHAEEIPIVTSKVLLVGSDAGVQLLAFSQALLTLAFHETGVIASADVPKPMSNNANTASANLRGRLLFIIWSP
jgi:hypothetical protein